MRDLRLFFAFALCLIAGNGCSSSTNVKTNPAYLARHWISDELPDIRGLLLRTDGSGVLAGNSPTSSKAPIKWYVQANKLFIQFYGEEGEHGDFEAHTFTVAGARLTVDPPILLQANFTAKM